MIRLFLIPVLFCAMTVGVRADDPRAVILEVEGTTTPQVESFEELVAGAKVDLAPGASLTISHYETCFETTIRGGSVSVGQGQNTFLGNKSLDRAGDSCVANVVLAEADLVSASIVTRSSNTSLPKISPLPKVVVLGADAPDYDTLMVRSGSVTVLKAPIVDGRARLPADVVALDTGTPVVLMVTGPGVQTRAARAMVVEAASGWVVLRQ